MNRYALLASLLIIATQVCFAQQYGSFKDSRDGRVYKTVKIGEQVWMAENLNVSKFRNGDIIPQAKSSEEWQKAAQSKKPAWCFFNNDSINWIKYGKLYNWYAVNDSRGLAPEGWHVSNKKEWEILKEYLIIHDSKSMKIWEENQRDKKSGVIIAPPPVPIPFGIKLITRNTLSKGNQIFSHAANSIGFSALSVSFRLEDGEFGMSFSDYFSANWWTSNIEEEEKYTFNNTLSEKKYNIDEVDKNDFDEIEFITLPVAISIDLTEDYFKITKSSVGMGYSVRCIKN